MPLVEAKTTRAVRVKTEDALDRAADGVQLEYSKTEALRYAGKEGIQPPGPVACERTLAKQSRE